jgi:hypothetical protein
VVRAPLLTLVVAVALANPAVAYEVTTVADGGAVAGVVKFAGTPLRLEPLSVHRNREVCGEQKAPEALVLGPERGVRGSVILVAGVVHDSPYYAVTDGRGAFRIDGIPAGSYKVVMWHEGFRPRGLDRDGRPRYDEPRTLTRDVTIAPGATATVDFELR